MRYYIRMITPTGQWFWNGQEPDQYAQWKDTLLDAQLYQRSHLAMKKASQLRTAITRLWVVSELEVKVVE